MDNLAKAPFSLFQTGHPFQHLQKSYFSCIEENTCFLPPKLLTHRTPSLVQHHHHASSAQNSKALFTVM